MQTGYSTESLDGDLLQVRDLAIEFEWHGSRIPVLHGVNFSIRPGGTVALVGESGSGKSITARAIMNILPQPTRVTRGEILLAPEKGGEPVDIQKLRPDSPRMRAIRGGRISMIFQEPMVSMSPVHTIGDQVSEALFLHRTVPRREGLRLSEEMLGLVGFPEPARAMDMYPFELSGGLRQRAMIAMALVCRPSLLIADEPTTALDVTIQAQILKLIRELQDQLGMAVLMITHDLGVVANIAEEVVVLYDGHVVEAGPVADIFERPAHPYLKALLRAVPHFEVKLGERLQPIREIRTQPGRILSTREGRAAPASSGPLLVARGLTKTFGKRKGGLLGGGEAATRTAVHDVSFMVRRGSCFGLVGESGCGKTTLAKMLMRAVRPDAGEIIYNDGGEAVNLLSLDRRALQDFRRKMQFVFQDPFGSLNPRMTVFDILREPLIIHRVGDRAYHGEVAQELMRLVGLDPRFLARYPHSFSGGQRQRIGIARALALQPEFLICDEPVSALDVSIQAQILNLLMDLQKELGLTYLFISHNLAVVHYLADRIAVMCRGRLVEVAPRERLFESPSHPYTRALLDAVPFPDLDKPLDFDAVTRAGLSDPTAWPEPYNERPERPTALVEVASGHFVRQAAAAPAHAAAE